MLRRIHLEVQKQNIHIFFAKYLKFFFREVKSLLAEIVAFDVVEMNTFTDIFYGFEHRCRAIIL